MLFVSVTLVMLVYTVISLCGGAFKDADIIGAIGAGCIVVTVVLMRAASRTRWL
jgi:hypothetical protein